MAWVAVDPNGAEFVWECNPRRGSTAWFPKAEEEDSYVLLPKGSIKKLIGRDLTWQDEPVELKADGQEG